MNDHFYVLPLSPGSGKFSPSFKSPAHINVLLSPRKALHLSADRHSRFTALSDLLYLSSVVQGSSPQPAKTRCLPFGHAALVMGRLTTWTFWFKIASFLSNRTATSNLSSSTTSSGKYFVNLITMSVLEWQQIKIITILTIYSSFQTLSQYIANMSLPP